MKPITLIEAIAQNVKLSVQRAEPSVGIMDDVYEIKTFDAEQAVRDYLKSDPVCGWFELCDLGNGDIDVITSLFLSGEAPLMLEKLGDAFVKAVNHELERSKDEVIALAVKYAECTDFEDAA